MSEAMLQRSLLYVPAANARAIVKAQGLGCDIVILDLEDAVAPEAKADARTAAIAALDARWGRRRVAIRINGSGTAWHREDCAAIAARARAGRGPGFVVVPKVESAADVVAVAEQTGVPVLAMIETRAIQRLGGIADAHGVAGLIAGFNDLARCLHARLDGQRTALLYAAAHMVNAARASGVLVFDGVFGDIRDTDGLARESGQAVLLGFDGKTCIHPGQLDAVNRAFTPGDGEVAEARGIVDAWAEARRQGRGIATFEGRMVEAMHAARAAEILALAEAAGRADGN
jgi:citrate lyase subunit beta/citryl-CoA lyase